MSGIRRRSGLKRTGSSGKPKIRDKSSNNFGCSSVGCCMHRSWDILWALGVVVSLLRKLFLIEVEYCGDE